MKKLLLVFLALGSSSFASELQPEEFGSTETTYKKCDVSSYDACPRALQWKCKRYAIHGESADRYVTTIAKKLRQNEAYEMLANLRGAGICP